jgi:hypothetical protein
MSNDEIANSMQQKITKRQNERHNPIPAVQSALLQLTNESFVNVASVGTSVLMSCAISRPCRPSSV